MASLRLLHTIPTERSERLDGLMLRQRIHHLSQTYNYSQIRRDVFQLGSERILRGAAALFIRSVKNTCFCIWDQLKFLQGVAQVSSAFNLTFCIQVQASVVHYQNNVRKRVSCQIIQFHNFETPLHFVTVSRVLLRVDGSTDCAC
ncbi:hypothetical protein F2P81_025855 [Scophthalmus maximus]|uniref:Uncharacterized protein n=1 Tax=Scophthalmus maximus TaxID=52904 RepID=A0A6A4RS93_SCOMX|nr:hypothetical protein F2P81_025855 [Scophthalmus maximus]